MTNKTAKMFVALSLAALQATTPAFASVTTSSTPTTNTSFNASMPLPAPMPHTTWVDRLLTKLANFFYPKQAIPKGTDGTDEEILVGSCSIVPNPCKYPVDGCTWQLNKTSGEYILKNDENHATGKSDLATDLLPLVKVLKLDDSILYVNSPILDDASNLEKIILPETLIYIYELVKKAPKLLDLTLPHNLREGFYNALNGYVLYRCLNIKTINVGNSSFDGFIARYSSVKGYTVDEFNSKYKSVDGILLSKNGTHLYEYPYSKAKTVIIPNGVKSAQYLITIWLQIFNGHLVTKLIYPPTFETLVFYSFCDQHFFYLSSKEPIINIDPFTCTNSVRVLKNYTSDDFYASTQFSTKISPFKSIEDFGYFPNNTTCWIYENNPDIGVTPKLTVAGFNALTITGECPWGKYGNEIKEISFEDGLTSIDATAFQNCTALETVSLPATVTEIAEGTFSSCPNLKTITVDPENPNFCDKDGVLFSKDGTMLMFYPRGNTSPTYDVPAGTQSFVGGSFDNNQSLTEIKLPASLVALAGALGELKNLQNVIVDPENPSFCEKNGVLFNKSGTYLYNYPLGRTSQAYTIPEGTKNIGMDAFGDNQSLEEIAIPASVETVIDYPFCELPKLSSINYLGSKDPGFTIDCIQNLQVNVYKDYNGDECMGHMVSRVFDKGNYNGIDWNFGPYGELTLSGSGEICAICPWEQYKNAIKKVTVKNDIEAIDRAAFYGYNFEKIELPENLKTIGRSAFESCEQLQAIVIPKSVEKIGESAFKNCKNLENITINANLHEIDEKTFYGCTKLSSFEIPTTVETIHSRAFKGCSNLHKIDIGGNVNIIGENVFMDCQSLESINVANNNKSYSSIDGVLFTKNGTTLLRYPANKNETSYEIPKTVETVGEFAFHKCNNLENVTMSDGCAISLNAFYNCESLKNVNLGSNITKIDDHSFAFCTNLDTVEYYGENDTAAEDLGTDIFYGCDKLKSSFC